MNMSISSHPDDEDWEVVEIGLPKAVKAPVLAFGVKSGFGGTKVDIHLESWESALKLATNIQQAHFAAHNKKAPTT